jgi:hypothetical protein
VRFWRSAAARERAGLGEQGMKGVVR